MVEKSYNSNNRRIRITGIVTDVFKIRHPEGGTCLDIETEQVSRTHGGDIINFVVYGTEEELKEAIAALAEFKQRNIVIQAIGTFQEYKKLPPNKATKKLVCSSKKLRIDEHQITEDGDIIDPHRRVEAHEA